MGAGFPRQHTDTVLDPEAQAERLADHVERKLDGLRRDIQRLLTAAVPALSVVHEEVLNRRLAIAGIPLVVRARESGTWGVGLRRTLSVGDVANVVFNYVHVAEPRPAEVEQLLNAIAGPYGEGQETALVQRLAELGISASVEHESDQSGRVESRWHVGLGQAAGVNRVRLLGTIGSKPVFRSSESGTACRLVLTTDQGDPERTEWHDVFALGGLAKQCRQLEIGERVGIDGRLRACRHEVCDGRKTRRVVVVADSVKLAEPENTDKGRR